MKELLDLNLIIFKVDKNMKIKKYKAKGLKTLKVRKGKIKSSQTKVGETDYFFPNELKTIRASSLKEATKKLRKE